MFRTRVLFGLCLISSLCAALNDTENSNPDSESSGSARILEHEFENQGDGVYKFSFKTSNGISREESAELIPSIHDEAKNVPKVTGTFSYPGPDGVMYSVRFIADESGFHPEGDHFLVPPFTPWIPGQPVDDGKYKTDNSGQYKPDNSGQYKPESDFTNNNIDDTNIPTKKIVPLPSKPNYISGESILDATLPARNKFSPVASEYLPASKFSKNLRPVTGEDISDQYRNSVRVTTEYLPAAHTTSRPAAYSAAAGYNVAFGNQATARPIFLGKATPNPAQYTVSAGIQNTVYSKPNQFNFPQPFAASQNSLNPLNQRSEEGAKYARSASPENEVKTTNTNQKFSYFDINPELRLLAGLL